MGPSAEEEFPHDAVEVGRIAGAWGIKGWIKVLPHSGDPQALFSSKRWYLKPPDEPGPVPKGGWPVLLRVTQARHHADGVVAGIDGMTDRDVAEGLRGARVFVSRRSFPTPDAEEFYWVDLIGLSVRNRQGETLGTVTGLLDTGVHSVLCVAPGPAAAPGETRSERLIPFVGAYVDRVDLSGRCIHVDWGNDY